MADLWNQLNGITVYAPYIVGAVVAAVVILLAVAAKCIAIAVGERRARKALTRNVRAIHEKEIHD
ncbi:hypothetical protein V9O75_002823 [Shigella sonnei]